MNFDMKIAVPSIDFNTPNGSRAKSIKGGLHHERMHQNKRRKNRKRNKLARKSRQINRK